MSISKATTILAIVIVLISVRSSSSISCYLEPCPNEGRYWVLIVNRNKLDSYINPNLFAYWLTRDNGFKLLYMYQEVEYLYVVDFRRSLLDGVDKYLRSKGEDEADICVYQKYAILRGQETIRQHPAVRSFGRNSYNLISRPEERSWRPHTFLLNQPVGCPQNNTESDWFLTKVNFVETEDERKTGTCFIDVTGNERPTSINSILPAFKPLSSSNHF